MLKATEIISKLHTRYVFGRRAAVLARILAELMPDGARVLDIGCGNGTISGLISKNKNNVSVKGIEVLKRPDCAIDCEMFDGKTIPFADSSFDVCMLIDVLHHAQDINGLLGEAARVSGKYVLIKDHLAENAVDFMTLKFMDWVGNRPYGVRLPYNYRSKCEWERSFSTAGLDVVSWQERIGLYPLPFNYIFGRRLHFIALLAKDKF